MIAVAAADIGFEVVYAGIRSSAAQLAQTALEESVDLIGLSILSGSHLALVRELRAELESREIAEEVKLVVGGIVPEADFEALKSLGVERVFTPSDYRLSDILSELLDLLEASS